MYYFLKENINLVFTLDCGTSSFDILDSQKYKNMDVIVIDHHISEHELPNIYSIINPNRFDEDSELKDLAAVGVTFLFIMGLRKILRENNYFIEQFASDFFSQRKYIGFRKVIPQLVNLIFNHNIPSNLYQPFDYIESNF